MTDKLFPVIQNCDYYVAIDKAYECNTNDPDIFINNIQIGNIGEQMEMDPSLMGLPVTKYNFNPLIIDFTISNNVEWVSPFHRIYKLTSTDFSTGSSIPLKLKGYNLIITLKSDLFPHKSLEVATITGCHNGLPILKSLTSQGGEFVSYQVVIAYYDINMSSEFTNKIAEAAASAGAKAAVLATAGAAGAKAAVLATAGAASLTAMELFRHL